MAIFVLIITDVYQLIKVNSDCKISFRVVKKGTCDVFFFLLFSLPGNFAAREADISGRAEREAIVSSANHVPCWTERETNVSSEANLSNQNH